MRLGLRLSALFALGAGQGLIGWWMVKSGLEEPASEYVEPRVSPYRLAAHLTSAFVIYSGLFWTALSVVMPEPPAESLAWVQGAAKLKRLAIPVSLIVGITALSGAFVAGNDAGRAYNTFPKMGDVWVPDNIFELKPTIRNFFENTSMVQLDHRILATTTLISICGLWWSTKKLDIHPAIRTLVGATFGMAALQVTLGVSTLLSYVPVSLGTAHQAGALTLLTLMLLLNHTVRRPSMSLLKTLPQVTKTAWTVMLAALAGMALAAPLLGMMGFSFLATLTLLFITSPLLLIFSPLLLFAGLVLMGALVGFAIAATMAFAGVSTLAWMYREIRGSLGFGSRRGQLVPGRYLQQTIQEK
ncbi:hypothetical protein Golob_001057 [Gossypium lobatum]|uniref:Uncharacterized protein n=1 Tax=Gossypium lobatum TaxID=34289 RepID=A0A7J8NAC8_9ROSI|nr:hypothetical protein [Gossypium lobatum]